MVETANDPRIPLKTDSTYKAFDFIQTEVGTMKELMVTITLSEYRNLVETKQYLTDRDQHMMEELVALREKLYAKD